MPDVAPATKIVLPEIFMPAFLVVGVGSAALEGPDRLRPSGGQESELPGPFGEDVDVLLRVVLVHRVRHGRERAVAEAVAGAGDKLLDAADLQVRQRPDDGCGVRVFLAEWWVNSTGTLTWASIVS